PCWDRPPGRRFRGRCSVFGGGCSVFGRAPVRIRTPNTEHRIPNTEYLLQQSLDLRGGELFLALGFADAELVLLAGAEGDALAEGKHLAPLRLLAQELE